MSSTTNTINKGRGSNMHTKTPWMADSIDCLRHTTGTDMDDSDYIGDIDKPDDAAFIVQCVNSHDDLLDALREIIAECPDPKLPYGIRVVEIAKAAIEAAEGR
jgi:hypothetical protein